MTEHKPVRAAMRRHVSTPALALFRQAGLAPDEIDAALDDLVRARGTAILRKGHGLLGRIEEASGITIAQIARRSRYLLLTIEQQADGRPLWQYREETPRRCRFSCRGQLPDTMIVGLCGQPLRRLVDLPAGMEDLVIRQIEVTGDGWLNVDVIPAWSVF